MSQRTAIVPLFTLFPGPSPEMPMQWGLPDRSLKNVSPNLDAVWITLELPSALNDDPSALLNWIPPRNLKKNPVSSRVSAPFGSGEKDIRFFGTSIQDVDVGTV